MLVMQQIPRAWKRDEVALRRFLALPGAGDLPNRRAVARPAGGVGPLVQRLSPLAALVPARLVGADLRGPAPKPASGRIDPLGQHHLQSPPRRERGGRQHSRGRSARPQPWRAVLQTARLRRWRGPHPPADRYSPGQHSDLRYATALASGLPACDAALDRGYVSAPLRAAFAAKGCTIHTPPKRGMIDPPDWNPKLYARRHHVENLFASLKDWARIALRRDKTHQSWMSFAHLAATMINLRSAVVSRRWWKFADGASGGVTVSVQAARSITRLAIGWPMVCHPSTLRRV
ncbi:MAG TPA: transposase, partial [Falsiroseomonas sp.]|nr:transposase [Falsiroseomonas sp.]